MLFRSDTLFRDLSLTLFEPNGASLRLPKGRSRLDILEEASRLAQSTSDCPLIKPETFAQIASEKRFTRSVLAMRSEARSLEALLEVLSQRITDSRSELTMMAQHLMQLGDEATGKLNGITQEFDSSSDSLWNHPWSCL